MTRLIRIMIPVLILTGCSSFNEKLAAGYVTVTSARDAATVLLEEDAINVADAENVLKATDNARAGLDIARQVHATDPAGGNLKLKQVLVGLHALDRYLEAKK